MPGVKVPKERAYAHIFPFLVSSWGGVALSLTLILEGRESYLEVICGPLESSR